MTDDDGRILTDEEIAALPKGTGARAMEAERQVDALDIHDQVERYEAIETMVRHAITRYQEAAETDSGAMAATVFNEAMVEHVAPMLSAISEIQRDRLVDLVADGVQCGKRTARKILKAPPKPRKRKKGLKTSPSVANFHASEVEFDGGRAKTLRFEVPLVRIIDDVHTHTKGWPKSVNGLLFSCEPVCNGSLPEHDAIRTLSSDADLFSWLRTRIDVEWTGAEVEAIGRLGKRSPVTRTELLKGLIAASPQKYRAVELLPHHPPRPDCYYVCGHMDDGDGSALHEFASMLNPETEYDRDLLIAALMSMFWGGEPGTRPAFLIESDHGVGSGKTATAEALGLVAGGVIALRPDEDWQRATERLLSDAALRKRAVLVDNLKRRLSRADIEAAITSDTINGKRLYHGDYERPNNITWLLTANRPQVSQDLADRCVVIKIGTQIHDIDFKTEVAVYIRGRRPALIRDILARLRGAPAGDIANEDRDRFQAWQDGVLRKLPMSAELAPLIRERRPTVDADLDEAAEIADAIDDLARRGGKCPIHDRIWIPTVVAMRHLNDEGYLEARSAKKFKRLLKARCSSPPLRYVNPDAREHGKGNRGLELHRPSSSGAQQSICSESLILPRGSKVLCTVCQEEGDGRDTCDTSNTLSRV